MSIPPVARTDRARRYPSSIALAALIAGTLLAAAWPSAVAVADECAPEDLACIAASPTPSDTPSPSDSTSPSASDSASPSDTPSPSDSTSPSPTDTPSPSDSTSPSPSPSDSTSSSPSDSASPTDTPTSAAPSSEPPTSAPPSSEPPSPTTLPTTPEPTSLPTTPAPTTSPTTIAPWPSPSPTPTPTPKPTVPAVTAVKVTGKTTISGTMKVGKTLKVSGLSSLSWNLKGVKVSYRWLVDGKSRSTKATYKLQDKDAGLKVVFEVAGTKSGYTGTSIKSAARAVPKLDSTTSLTLGYLQAKVATTAKVTVKAATLAPVGTVSIRANGKVVGSAKLKASNKGKIVVRIKGMAPGKYSIVATFDGSDQINKSKSELYLISIT